MNMPSTTYFSLADDADLPSLVRHVDTKLGVLREALDSTLVAKELARIVDRRDLAGVPRSETMIEEACKNVAKRAQTEEERAQNACDIAFYEDTRTRRIHGVLKAHQMRWYKAIVLTLPGVTETHYKTPAKGREESFRLLLNVTLGEKDMSSSYLINKGMIPLLTQHVPSRGHRALDHAIDRAAHILHSEVREAYPYYHIDQAIAYTESHPPYTLASLIRPMLIPLRGDDLVGRTVGPIHSKSRLFRFHQDENTLLRAWLDESLRETLLSLAA